MLCTLLASYGLQGQMVSNNGPQFTSSIFKSFLKNNVKQTLSPPYHPALNGAPERSIWILKGSLIKQVLHSGDKLCTFRKLVTFLFTYRNTPHMVGGKTPALMFLKKSPKQEYHYCIRTLQSQLRNNRRTNKGTMTKPITS